MFRVNPVAETAVFSRLQRNPELSAADVAVLARAATADGTAVIDETHGRTVATTEDITTRGTAYVVVLLAKRGVISVAAARTITDELADSGWYCAPDTCAKRRQQLEAFGD